MALAQTADGFLWLGTPTGLYRFDGIRFEHFHSQFGEQLLPAKIYSLFAPPSGGLWIGYVSGGISFLNNGRVTNDGGETAISGGTVGGFIEDRDGLIWAWTVSGLLRFNHSSWQRIGTEWNPPPPGGIIDMGIDGVGTIWVLTAAIANVTELSYLSPDSGKFRTTKINLPAEGFTLGPDRKVVTSAASKRLMQGPSGDSKDSPLAYPLFGNRCYQLIDRTNSVWSAFAWKPPVLLRSPGPGTSHDALSWALRKGTETYRVNPYVGAKLVDREGNVWFGDKLGLHRFFYSPLVRQQLPGKAGNMASGLASAERGAVWISSFVPTESNFFSASLYLVSNGKVELRRSIPASTGMSYRSPDNTLWFEGTGVIWHLVNGKLERVELPSEVAGKYISWQVITQDRAGGLWLSLWGSWGDDSYRLANGSWTRYGGRNDFPQGRVATEFTDNLGRVWFGYIHNILAVLDNDRLQVFRGGDGLAVGDVTAIYGRGSEIWIGGNSGLQQFDRGQFHSIKAVDEEWLRGISGIAETADGDLWINGLSGIFHVRSSEISAALKDPTYLVTGDHISQREGADPIVMTSHTNAAIEGTDGKLWFWGPHGVVWLDPTRLETRGSPPPISIQSISADDKFYAPASPLKLPAHTSSVQINYAAVSLSEPEAIRIRYKLQEVDKDWHELARANPVTYRNLVPGAYHFSVAARDRRGLWAGGAAAVEFTILPAFYQTRWFVFLCATALIGLIWLGLRVRMKHVAAVIRERAEVRADERVRIARDLHDTLLQGVQGLTLSFHVATQELPEDSRSRKAMERALATADRIVVEGRDRVNRLRSEHFTYADLTDAFEAVADDLNYEQRVRFALKIDGGGDHISPHVLEELHYIGREAISNAFRHSGASAISARLICRPDSVVLTVADNGHGFDPVFQETNHRAGRWGLRGMKERAEVIGARFECHSTLNKGTEVVVTLRVHRVYRKSPPAART